MNERIKGKLVVIKPDGKTEEREIELPPETPAQPEAPTVNLGDLCRLIQFAKKQGWI